ncbi:hypothetical protein [Delftia sp. PS-11]|uniref:hypothetical protein n=1 Tax=Delftia sp. PS-11 TaxID=2767222 RepID=UPI0024544FCF|nr:hypothetical protein [Delftia sp. PS-11]KAJ8743695.1 hypothetical protein H9T68_15985 [Delftia sp. PS-11]
MGRYAEIKDGVVVNHVLATAAFAREQGWIAAGDSRIGDLWDGTSFAPAPEPPEPVPAAISRRQGQLVLHALGLLEAAEAAITGIADPLERRAAQIEYEASTWERSNAFLAGLWAQLGGTPASLDEAFRTAVTL